jgi:hypothetical protein
MWGWSTLFKCLGGIDFKMTILMSAFVPRASSRYFCSSNKRIHEKNALNAPWTWLGSEQGDHMSL